jgi:hypothetical protein
MENLGVRRLAVSSIDWLGGICDLPCGTFAKESWGRRSRLQFRFLELGFQVIEPLRYLRRWEGMRSLETCLEALIKLNKAVTLCLMGIAVERGMQSGQDRRH